MAAATTPKRPAPAYDAIPLDKELYSRIAETGSVAGGRVLSSSFTVPIRSGRAWTVKAGQVCRILTPEGPQVGDLNVWNLQNPRERFWAARTRQLQQSHVKLFDRLWSCLPYLRPLVTVTAVSAFLFLLLLILSLPIHLPLLTSIRIPFQHTESTSSAVESTISLGLDAIRMSTSSSAGHHSISNAIPT